MKKLYAFLIAVCLLMSLSLSACGNGESSQGSKSVTLYVVTSQKNYTDGVLTDETTFTYDAKARPLVIEWKRQNGTIMQTELTYDPYGNRTSETSTWIYPDRDDAPSISVNYEFTYSGDRATYCTSVHESGRYGMSLEYDDAGRLVLVDYDEAYTKAMMFDWHSFTYDSEGRLVADTLCETSSGQSKYWLKQIQYSYDAQGNLVEHCCATASSENPVSPEEAAGMEFSRNDVDHYFFSYDQKGNLETLKDANGNQVNPGTDIYDNPNYTFDNHGNLLSVESGNTRTEYTYTTIELTASEAEMAKRLMHGASDNLLMYTYVTTMDPLFWEICPAMLYAPYLQCPFYYLVPYPQWQINM